jgi:hypothetical protein
VKPVIDKYFVVQHVTVQEHGDKESLNNPGGDAMMKRLGGDGGLPYFAFLSAEGDTLVTSNEPGKDGKKGGNIGHPAQPNEIDWFLVMLHKAAAGITAGEVAPLEKYLRNQKK